VSARRATTLSSATSTRIEHDARGSFERTRREARQLVDVRSGDLSFDLCGTWDCFGPTYVIRSTVPLSLCVT
jgi:hypothetical protein